MRAARTTVPKRRNVAKYADKTHLMDAPRTERTRLLPTARHAADDERDLSDGIHRPAKNHLHPIRGEHAAPHLYRRAQLAGRTRAVVCWLFDRPLACVNTRTSVNTCTNVLDDLGCWSRRRKSERYLLSDVLLDGLQCRNVLGHPDFVRD